MKQADLWMCLWNPYSSISSRHHFGCSFHRPKSGRPRPRLSFLEFVSHCLTCQDGVRFSTRTSKRETTPCKRSWAVFSRKMHQTRAQSEGYKTFLEMTTLIFFLAWVPNLINRVPEAATSARICLARTRLIPRLAEGPAHDSVEDTSFLVVLFISDPPG